MAESQKSYWLKSGFLSLFEKGSVFVFGFGTIYILARAFTLVEFGTLSLFYTIASFIEVGRNGLIQNALVKYASTTEGDDRAVISTASLLLSLILTFFIVLLLYFGATPLALWLKSPQLAPLLRIYCITTFILVPFHQFNHIQQANLDFKGIFWSNFCQKGTFFGYFLILYLISAEITLEKVATFQIVTASIGAFVSYLIGRKYLSFSLRIDWSWVTRLFRFGFFVFGTNLNTMLNKSIDRLMLGSLIGPAAAGIYDWAIRITNLVEVPTFSVASIVFPQSAQRSKNDGNEAVKYLYERSVGLILAIVVPFILFVFVFADYVILFLASEKYLDSVPLLRITILFGFIIPYAVQFGTILDSMGKPVINFWFTLVGAILNVIFNFFFIKQFGVIGAAYGTMASYLIIFIGTQTVLNRLIGVRPQNALIYMMQFYKQEIPKGYHKIKNKLSPEHVEIQ